MRFQEIETKYRVSDLKLTDYTKSAQALGPSKYVEAAGYDYYFVNDACDDFMRFRAGDRNELTRKKKTKLKNNFVREEWNLLIAAGQPLSKVAGFCSSLGFPHLNFCIFKACFIYYYPTFDLVYYVIYDEDMKEVDRFLEIEILEDSPFETEELAWQELVRIEQMLKPLGISPQGRIRKSLFEMFKR